MKTVIKNGSVFYKGKFQQLDKMILENGKILEISIVSANAKKNKPITANKKSKDEKIETIDCSGKYVLPGFIDPHTHLSLEPDGVGHLDSDTNETYGLITPHIRAYDAIKMRDRAIKDALQGGVTTAMITPGSANPIGGQCCIVKLIGNTIDEACINDFCAMKFAFGENPKRVYGGQGKFPSTRMGNAATIREWLMKAQDYKKKKKNKDFKDRDIRLEALLPLIDRKIPARAHAHQADDIVTAHRIAQEFNIDIVFDHCTEGHLIAKKLGDWKAKAVVGPSMTTRKKPEVANKTFETPKILMDEGVIVALTTDHPVMPAETLSVSASMAVRYGLDDDRALLAITENPAIILGIDKRVGKLEKGYDADVVVWNGHPLDTRSKPEYVFINGEKIVDNMN